MKTEKTLSEQIQSFAEQVESMSNFKNETSKRGQEIYKDYQDRLPSVIQDLRNKGVNENTHPKFANAMIMYSAWK